MGVRLGERDKGDLSGSGPSNWMVVSFPETGNTGRGLDEKKLL